MSWTGLFDIVDPKSEIPPPPADFVEWANTTLFGAYLGAMIMGTREAVRVRYEPLPPSIMRANAQNMKLYNVYRVCRKASVGAVQVGVLTAIYRGAQTGLARDPYSLSNVQATAVASSTTAALLGAALPGLTRPSRLKYASAGALCGGLLGAAVEWANEEALKMLPEDIRAQVPTRESTSGTLASAPARFEARAPAPDSLSVVIQQLEASLASRHNPAHMSDLGELRKLEAELKAALAQLRAQGGGARLEEIEQQLQLIDRRKVELKAGGKK